MSIVRLLIGLPSLSRCTTLSYRSQSAFIRSIAASLLAMSWVMVWSRNSESPRPLLNDLRSLSNAAIRFSSFALSRRSVLPDRIAMYSEKFIPFFSSIDPSSIVRAPNAPLLSWLMNVALQWRRLNL